MPSQKKQYNARPSSPTFLVIDRLRQITGLSHNELMDVAYAKLHLDLQSAALAARLVVAASCRETGADSSLMLATSDEATHLEDAVEAPEQDTVPVDAQGRT